MFIISNFITIIWCSSSHSYKIIGKVIWWNFTSWSQPYSFDRDIVQIIIPQLHQYCLVSSCVHFRNHNACPLYFLTLTHFADDSISCWWGFVEVLLNFQGSDTKNIIKVNLSSCSHFISCINFHYVNWPRPKQPLNYKNDEKSNVHSI